MLEICLIYLVGLLQGIAFVTVPAAGTLLTNPNFQALSKGEYGALFIPMIIGAIGASLMGRKIGKTKGLKEVLLFGLFCNIIAMLLFSSSSLFYASRSFNYLLLLVSLLFLGLGFGSTITILKTYVERLFPSRTAVAMACMHTLLGLGTALAPLLLSYFYSIDAWWANPLALSAIFGVLFALCSHFVSNIQAISVVEESRGFSLDFWLFVGIIFLYGYCETTFGNWATIYLHTDKGFSIREASYALSVFWAMVMVGRILLAVLCYYIQPGRIYLALPILIFIAFLVIPFFSGVSMNIALFGFAGLACSGFFPLTFTLGEKAFSSIASVIAGWSMVAYMLGYGTAAFGIGLAQAHYSLNTLYLLSTLPAAIMAALVVFILWRRGQLTIGQNSKF